MSMAYSKPWVLDWGRRWVCGRFSTVIQRVRVFMSTWRDEFCQRNSGSAIIGAVCSSLSSGTHRSHVDACVQRVLLAVLCLCGSSSVAQERDGVHVLITVAQSDVFHLWLGCGASLSACALVYSGLTLSVWHLLAWVCCPRWVLLTIFLKKWIWI